MIAIMTTSQNWGEKKNKKKIKLHYLCVTSKNRWSKYGDINSFSSSVFFSQNMANFGDFWEIWDTWVLSGVQSSSDRLESHPPPAPSKEKSTSMWWDFALGRRGSTHCSATVVGRKLRLAKSRHTREKHFCLWARRERTHLQEFSSSAFARLV
jgi:hypothetical protein